MKLGHTALVRLHDWEYEHARHVGHMRWKIRLDSPDAPHYRPERMEDNLTASIASAATELAVGKYKGLYYSGHYWEVEDHDLYKGFPDVEPNIEVRRAREAGNPLPVRRRDVKAGRLMVCGWPDPDTAFKEVYLIGEIDAQEGWDRGRPADYDRTDTRLVPQAFLNLYGVVKRAA